MNNSASGTAGSGERLWVKRRSALRALVTGAAGALLLASVMLPVIIAEPEAQETALSPGAASAIICGRMFAVTAAVLMFFQFILSSRIKMLDRLFGLNRLLDTHRYAGTAAAVLATLHPLFLFFPEQEEIGPLRLDLWPELFGIVLLCGLWAAVCVSLWRVFLRLRFERWWLMHRMGVFAGMVLLSIHALNVGGDFITGLPRAAFAAALAGYAVLFLWVKAVKPGLLRARPYTIAEVSRLSRTVHAIELVPARGKVFSYMAGQFAFVRFFSRNLPSEEHHFTLSSAPTRDCIIFTIKCSGDFTSRIGRLAVGDTAMIDGPYGLFSCQALSLQPADELIMIAGGIGITPMLSMLRYAADIGERWKITLVWSNRTQEDMFCNDELEQLGEKLPRLAFFPVLTRQPDYKGLQGRLDSALLGKMLAESSRSAYIFLCGPPDMMDAVRAALVSLGFEKRRILSERFSL